MIDMLIVMGYKDLLSLKDFAKTQNQPLYLHTISLSIICVFEFSVYPNDCVNIKL